MKTYIRAILALVACVAVFELSLLIGWLLQTWRFGSPGGVIGSFVVSYLITGVAVLIAVYIWAAIAKKDESSSIAPAIVVLGILFAYDIYANSSLALREHTLVLDVQVPPAKLIWADLAGRVTAFVSASVMLWRQGI